MRESVRSALRNQCAYLLWLFNTIMKTLSKIILPFLLLVFQHISYAESYSQGEALTIDETIPETVNLEFSDASDLSPKIGEFKILSSILMSNLSGERWATVTMKNLSSGQRILDKEHVVAIFANGEKRNPSQAEYRFSGQEEITMIINFGKSKFPILRVRVSK